MASHGVILTDGQWPDHAHRHRCILGSIRYFLCLVLCVSNAFLCEVVYRFFFEYFELMPKHFKYILSIFVNGITVLRFTHTLFLFQFCSQLFYARSPFLLRFCPLLSYFLPPFAPHHSPHLFPASFAPRFLLNSLLWGEAGLQMAWKEEKMFMKIKALQRDIWRENISLKMAIVLFFSWIRITESMRLES